MSFFLLLLYVTASYIRPAELYKPLVPYRLMLWLGVAAMVASGFSLLMGRRPTFRAPQIYLMFGLLAAVLLSRIAQGWFGGAVLALEEFGVTAAAFFLLIFNVISWRRIRILVFLLGLLSMVLVIQGVLAYRYGYWEDLFVLKQTTDDLGRAGGEAMGQQDEESLYLKRIRAMGFLNDPNDLAQALLIMLPFLGLAWRKGRRLRNLIFVGAPAVILLFGIFLTHSRGGMVGLIVLALLALRDRLSRTRALVLTAALVLALLAADFTGGRGFSPGDESAHTRLDAWAAGLQMLKAKPILGVGYRGFEDSHERTAHNSFVLCFAELGLIGYFFWMGLLVVTLAEISSLKKLPIEAPGDEDLRRWATAMRLALYAFLVAAWFLSRTYIFTLYLLVAMGAALSDLARRKGKALSSIPLFGWATRVAALELGSIAFVYAIVKIF